MPVIPPPYTDYIPASDADYSTWLNAFQPAYLASGLTSPDPATLNIEKIGWNNAYAAATAGGTRGPMTIATKDASRASSQALARLCAQAMVAAYRQGVLTSTDLVDAGVRVPSDLQTPRLPPAQGPDLILVNVTPGMINLAIQQPGAAGSKKPIGCVGAEIRAGAWTANNTVPPAALEFVGLATRKKYSLSTPGVAGTQLLIAANWLTVRGAVSPLGTGINVFAS